MLAVLFFIGIGALMIWSVLRVEPIRKTPLDLDLDSVRDALIEKQGWTRERAEAARVEYIRFLTLLQRKPGFMLVPWLDGEGRDDLDQFWHQHILDTAKYAADCNTLFGKMIHHNPNVLRGSDEEKYAVDRTRRLYARTFGSGGFGTPVDGADLIGCAACATSDGPSDSHGSGGHHGDAGGHGGHSCGGGHGCGGHGCGGHGCGGH